MGVIFKGVGVCNLITEGGPNILFEGEDETPQLYKVNRSFLCRREKLQPCPWFGNLCQGEDGTQADGIATAYFLAFSCLSNSLILLNFSYIRDQISY